jgi:polyhydroxyalkanoate synthesis regulator phasin
MDARADGSAVEKLALAALGAVSLTADRADQLADALAEKGGLRRDEARALVHELTSRWRGDALRVSEQAGEGLAGLFRQLGLVTRADFDELELRVAQLEHRLRLLENAH